MNTVRIKRVCGRDILPWLDQLAALRIRVFREFPYLYDGSLAYEHAYLAEYAESDAALIVLAVDGELVVGCSTGLPLTEAAAAFRQPFANQGRDPAEVFYFGESVLDQAYRGQGLGHRFFDEREAQAQRLGLKTSAFCAVSRPPDHPLRPKNYRPLDGFWQRRAYVRHPELVARFAWKDIDQPEETCKELIFWLRSDSQP